MNIPEKNRKEWTQLLRGQINVPLKNFFFQMKVTQTQNLLKQNRVSIEQAVDDLYNLCNKFSKAAHMSDDIEAIFTVNTFKASEEIRTEDVTNIKENEVKSKIQEITESAKAKRKELETFLAEKKRVEEILEAERKAKIAMQLRKEDERAAIERQRTREIDLEKERQVRAANEKRRLEEQQIRERRLLEERRLKEAQELKRQEMFRANTQKNVSIDRINKSDSKKQTPHRAEKRTIGYYFKSLFGIN